MRKSVVILMIFCAMSAYALFDVKHRVQNLKKDLIAMHQQLAKDKESIHVLKAEWAYLNQPDRLRRLAEKHLNLEHVMADRLKTPDAMYDMIAANDPADVVPMLKPIKVSARGY